MINFHISNPFSTGAGGATFEQLVGASYLVSLLSLEIPRGIDGLIENVRFQQRYKGFLVDDIVVETKDGNITRKLSIQVKHALTFSDNDLFRDVLKDCWEFFMSGKFSTKKDRIAIGVEIGSYPRTVARDLQELLQWAKTSNCAADFIQITSKFKKKRHYLTLFKTILSRFCQTITDDELWQFLKCFVVLPFDLENEGSGDSCNNWNKLLNLIKNRDPEMAKLIFEAMTAVVAEYAKSAGTINYETLMSKLPKAVLLNNPSNLDSPLRNVRGYIFNLVNNQIQKQKNSTKYIPDVFIEIDDVKDKARYFTDPTSFWDKILEDVKRLDFRFLNKYLNELGISSFSVNLPADIAHPVHIREIGEKSDRLIAILEDKLQELISLRSQNIRIKVPAEKVYFFEEVNYKFQTMWPYTHKIERILDSLRCINAKVLFLTSTAGQGKTNFVCDLVENVIQKKSLLSVFFTAADFNNVDLSDMGKYILSRLFGGSLKGALSDFLEAIRDICYRDGCTFTLIVDGLNEHINISVFSQALETFTESLLKYDFVKVIFTCRSEYFNQRFYNFERSSFSNKTVFLKDFTHSMNPKKKKRMLRAYFRFFRLSVSSIWNSAYDKLTNDPLLLRIFCQAYGDHTSATLVHLPELRDIYKENLFRKYFEVKLDEIDKKKITACNIHLGEKITLRKLLRQIVEYMLKQRTFADIPLSDIFQKDYEVELGSLIEENIILRKDLTKANVGILDESREVLNFTFDEFRDFLIADHLVYAIFSTDKREFEGIIDELTKHTYPMSEGISKYLFYISRRLNNAELTAILETKEWFHDLFLECVFSTDDKFITDRDIELVKTRFKENIASSSQIALSLINRYDTEAFRILNVDLLFSILSELGESQYGELFAPVFVVSKEDSLIYRSHVYWKLYDFTSNLEAILGKKDLNRYPAYHKLFEALIFMLGLRDDYFAYITIRGLYEKYALKYPDIAVKKLMTHSNVKNKLISTSIWTVLTYLVQRDIKIPSEFSKEKVVSLMGITAEVEDIPPIDQELSDFLMTVQKKVPRLFSKEEIEFIMRVSNAKHYPRGRYDF